jgi:hypothetical protein
MVTLGTLDTISDGSRDVRQWMVAPDSQIQRSADPEDFEHSSLIMPIDSHIAAAAYLRIWRPQKPTNEQWSFFMETGRIMPLTEECDIDRDSPHPVELLIMEAEKLEVQKMLEDQMAVMVMEEEEEDISVRVDELYASLEADVVREGEV